MNFGPDLFRKTFLAALIWVASAYHSAGQEYPIPAENAEWGTVTCWGPPGPGSGCKGRSITYEIKDSLHFGRPYQYWGEGIFTRYINNKLLMLDTVRSREEERAVEAVYYDFNLEPGDQFLIPMWYDSIYGLVDEVDTFHTLNGQKRRRIRIRIEDITCTGGLLIIEGLGDLYHSVFYTQQIGFCDIYESITCYSDSSGLVYQEEGTNYDCEAIDDYYVSTFTLGSDERPDKISLHPNPFNDQLLIDVPFPIGSHSITIFNTLGKQMLRTSDASIATDGFKPGIYIVTVENNGQLHRFKVVKKQ